MSVTRCVCHRQRFADLLPLCRSQGWTTPAEIARQRGAGSGCGACLPYLQAMLATGATRFAIARPGEAPRPCGREPWDDE